MWRLAPGLAAGRGRGWREVEAVRQWWWWLGCRWGVAMAMEGREGVGSEEEGEVQRDEGVVGKVEHRMQVMRETGESRGHRGEGWAQRRCASRL